jgi:hypothetical protein
MKTSRKISTTIAIRMAIHVPLILVGRIFFGAVATAGAAGAVGIGSVTGVFGVSSLGVATTRIIGDPA